MYVSTWENSALSTLALLKFGLSEKHTKFEKNLPHGLYIYLVKSKPRGIFFQNLCASQKVQTLGQNNFGKVHIF